MREKWFRIWGGGNPTAMLIGGGLILYAIASALKPTGVKLLYLEGMNHPVHGLNPVTFCNILLVTSLLSAICIAGMFHRDLAIENWRRVSRRQWLVLSIYVLATCAAIPALNFSALQSIQVSELIIIGSLRMTVGFVVSLLVFSERVGLRQWLGQGIITLAIALHFVLFKGIGNFALGAGEVMALIAANLAVVAVLTYKELAPLPVGLLAFVGQIVGAIVFFWVAILYFGPHHFDTLAAPWVWEVLALYTLAVLVSQQLLKQFVYRYSSRQEIFVVSGAMPVFSTFIAWLVLDDDVQYVELAISGAIGVGTLIALLPGASARLGTSSERIASARHGYAEHLPQARTSS